jgi:hypothetical protein
MNLRRHSHMRRVLICIAGLFPVLAVASCTAGEPATLAVSHYARAYHDSAGWSVKVPPGWHAITFTDSKNGITATGVQLSNVKLPRPALAPGYPIQVNNRVLPAGGVGLIIAADPDPRLSHGQVSEPPLPAPDGPDWMIGSALAGTPYMEALWFRVNGKIFIACAKVGPNAAKSDRNAIASIIRSLH